jgi:hypothetical protein
LAEIVGVCPVERLRGLEFHEAALVPMLIRRLPFLTVLSAKSLRWHVRIALQRAPGAARAKDMLAGLC